MVLRFIPPAVLFSFFLAPGCASDPPSEAVIGPGADDTVQREVAAARDRLTATEGGRLVLRAIEAHGGLEAWYRAPTSAYTWTYANRDADLHFSSYLVADNRTRRVYHDLHALGPYGDPQDVEGRFAWDGADAWIAPDTLTRFNPRFWATTGYYFEQIPFVLADPGLRYERLPDDTLDGRPHPLVRVGFDPGVGDSPEDTYVLYLHPETGRVEAVRYTVTYGRVGGHRAVPSETLLYYEGYRSVDGLMVPTHFRGYAYEDGRIGRWKSEAWADSISFRRPFDEARLRAPAGARIARPPGEG